MRRFVLSQSFTFHSCRESPEGRNRERRQASGPTEGGCLARSCFFSYFALSEFQAFAILLEKWSDRLVAQASSGCFISVTRTGKQCGTRRFALSQSFPFFIAKARKGEIAKGDRLAGQPREVVSPAVASFPISRFRNFRLSRSLWSNGPIVSLLRRLAGVFSVRQAFCDRFFVTRISSILFRSSLHSDLCNKGGIVLAPARRSRSKHHSVTFLSVPHSLLPVGRRAGMG
jgi:hypothetical protein